MMALSAIWSTICAGQDPRGSDRDAQWNGQGEGGADTGHDEVPLKIELGTYNPDVPNQLGLAACLAQPSTSCGRHPQINYSMADGQWLDQSDGPALRMDQMVGQDFEMGLANLCRLRRINFSRFIPSKREGVNNPGTSSTLLWS
ncbi:hypothetical protein SBP18_20630 [Rhodoferax ferrireducens]|uniref:hypothetical protein n=1 Tax=Rhodoferax ferrireducens TaxID=192843 RepID=UPI00298ECEC7|nr:hypothetical protein [Rhodoferax ferrireducens]WPC66844.1 hypothetical protein SBP18_20630 [Rhodoferax ferrireducens]